MELGNIIGSGRYRDCYEIKNSNLCVKKLKDSIKKNHFGLDINYNLKNYIKFKFGIESLNKLELEIINNLPNNMDKYLPNIINLIDDDLIVQRPMDFNGNYSKTLLEYGKLDNDSFWMDIENIKSIFLENELYFNDIFNKGNNILVQKISSLEYKPIIIDFKKLGNNMYPFQLNLYFKSEQKKKFKRRFNYFENKFKVN